MKVNFRQHSSEENLLPVFDASDLFLHAHKQEIIFLISNVHKSDGIINTVRILKASHPDDIVCVHDNYMS